MLGVTLKLLAWIGLSPIPWIAYMIGTTEAALNLLISILLGYFLATVYHKYVRIDPVRTRRHLFFIFSGLDISFFNFGFSFYHNLIPVVVLYLTTLFCKPGKIHVIVTFIFNMGYLLVGYAMTESEDYDITWTMPHCVLTLKLIALSFDLWDGQKMTDGRRFELSTNNYMTAITKAPSLLQLCGFVYFPASFLVGPLFSFKRYSEFVDDKGSGFEQYPLDDSSASRVRNIVALRTLLLGILFLIVYQVGVLVFDIKYMLMEEFLEHSIFYRHLYCGLWAHFALYKYISCWLLTEAACIKFGLSYNGRERLRDAVDIKITKWDGCSNIKLQRFLFATKFQHYIDSFNCNTNYFAAEYIYKRLKFLGNRNASQLITLIFLALWHGIRSGYYATFLNEFLIILMEKDVENLLNRTRLYYQMWASKRWRPVLYVLLKLYTIVFMGWSLVPFDLKVFSKWWPVYTSLWFSGYIIFLPWSFLYKPLVNKFMKKYYSTHHKRF